MTNQLDRNNTLRAEAEKRINDYSLVSEALPEKNLLHELQVHQIELEMQNETLLQAQLALGESNARYKDLYDFAPVGYLTLDTKGLIVESNLTAARLLGVERKQLSGNSFSRYLAEEDVGRWRQYFRKILQDEASQLTELMLKRSDGREIYAGFDGCYVASERVRITFSDTTQRRLVELALAESREQLSLFIEYAPSAIAMFDVDMRYIAYSRRWISDYGLAEKGDLTGLSHYQIFPEVPERWREIHRRCLAGAIEKCEEDPFPRADGTVDWVRWEIHPWRHSNGAMAGIIIFSELITARVQAEHSLRESEEMFRAIFDGALDGILLLDPKTGRFSRANPAFCRLIGILPGELTGFSVQDIHPAEDIAWINEDIQRHLRGEIQMSPDIPVLRRDGSVFYVDIRSSPVLLQGKTYLLGLFRDNSTRRELEEVRRTSELKHRLLFEASHDALMTLAPPSWQFTGANEATLKLFGADSQHEFMNRGPWGVSPEFQPDGEGSAEKALKMIAIAMQEGSHSFEWLHQRMDGTPFFAEVLLTRIDLGTEVFIQATVRDITHRRQADHALRESQQLLRDLAAQSAASREAELKHVAREVHDELGQILTAVRMDVSLLRMQFGEQNPQLHQKIQDMMVLVDKAIQGVRDVTVNLRPPALDMGLVSALTWLTNDFNSRNNTACSLRLFDNPRELTEAQTVVIFRIVQESLTNVVRHAAASRVDITLTQIDTGIEIVVQDDGQGFDETLKSGRKSFGLLGMKERALAVNGRVNVTSTPGKGTVVSVYIPFDSVRPKRRRNDDTPANS
jgi:PAS domain S-box-containing protein